MFVLYFIDSYLDFFGINQIYTLLLFSGFPRYYKCTFLTCLFLENNTNYFFYHFLKTVRHQNTPFTLLFLYYCCCHFSSTYIQNTTIYYYQYYCQNLYYPYTYPFYCCSPLPTILCFQLRPCFFFLCYYYMQIWCQILSTFLYLKVLYIIVFKAFFCV